MEPGNNRRTRRKRCPSGTLSTSDRTVISLGLNRGLQGEKPVTDILCHDTADDFFFLRVTFRHVVRGGEWRCKYTLPSAVSGSERSASGKKSPCPLKRKLWVPTLGRRKNLYLLPDVEARFFGHPAQIRVVFLLKQ